MSSGDPFGDQERRQARRFRIALPVRVESTTGWTRDVSAMGAFFTVSGGPDRPPDPGALIQVGLVLEHGDPGGRLDIRCEGTVVRVDQSANFVGVAVQFDSYLFIPPHVAPTPPES